jgi:hypothetical protein
LVGILVFGTMGQVLEWDTEAVESFGQNCSLLVILDPIEASVRIIHTRIDK